MAVLRDKYHTLAAKRVAGATHAVAQRLLAHEIGEAMCRDGPWIERAAGRIPLKVDSVNIMGNMDYAKNRRQFCVEVLLSVDEDDLRNLY